MTWLAIKLFAGNALGAALRFLRHASVWQLVALGLTAFALVQHFQLAGERRHSAKLQTQVVKLTDELTRISTAKNVQKQTTVRTVETARIIYRDSDKQARKVEQAPLPGQCATPSLDTLRNVL